MVVAGTNDEVFVNRKIDSIIGAKARIFVRRASKRKEWNMSK